MVEIKNWVTENILFSSEKETIKEAAEEAASRGANLGGANLTGANLGKSRSRLFERVLELGSGS